METLRNTFKSHSNRFSGGGTTHKKSHEDVPVPSDDPHVEIDVPDPPDHTDTSALSREPSVKFWQAPAPESGSDSTRHGVDSSSSYEEGELIGKQSNSCGELSLTLDMDVDPEIGKGRGRHESADAAHVSFEQPVRGKSGNETPTIWKSSSPGFDDRKSVGKNQHIS